MVAYGLRYGGSVGRAFATVGYLTRRGLDRYPKTSFSLKSIDGERGRVSTVAGNDN